MLLFGPFCPSEAKGICILGRTVFRSKAPGIHEVHLLAPVGRRQAPAVALPGVGDLLVPAVVEDTASVWAKADICT